VDDQRLHADRSRVLMVTRRVGSATSSGLAQDFLFGVVCSACRASRIGFAANEAISSRSSRAVRAFGAAFNDAATLSDHHAAFPASSADGDRHVGGSARCARYRSVLGGCLTDRSLAAIFFITPADLRRSRCW